MNAGIKIAGLNINIKNIPFMNEETEDVFVEKYFKEADFEYKVILSEEDFVLKGVCILRDGKKSIYSLDNGNYAIKFFIDTKDGKTICYTFFDFENEFEQEVLWI